MRGNKLSFVPLKTFSSRLCRPAELSRLRVYRLREITFGRDGETINLFLFSRAILLFLGFFLNFKRERLMMANGERVKRAEKWICHSPA